MIDLVLTHLDHIWGPTLWFDALKSVPVLDFGHFRRAPKWPISPKMAIFKHVGNGQNVTLELISVHQTINGDPNKWAMRLVPYAFVICVQR